MRILRIINVSELGGTQRGIVNLAIAEAQRGHDVIVAAGDNPDGFLFKELSGIPGITTHYLHTIGRERVLIRPRSLWELYHLIRATQPDIVQIHVGTLAYTGVPLCRLMGIPVVYSPHGNVLMNKLRPISKIVHVLLEKCTCALAHAVIVTNTYEESYMTRLLLLKPGSINVIPHRLSPRQTSNYDFSATTQDALIREFTAINPSFIQSKLNVVTIANYYPPKGLEYLITAAAEVLRTHPDAVFYLIGEGSEREKLEQLIKDRKLNDQVILTGKIQDAPRFLGIFRLFVLSSVKESYTRSLMEARMSGIPVVCTAVGGNDEMKEDNWLIVPPANPHALALAISTALAFKRRVPVSRARIEEEFNSYVTQCQNLYQHIIDTHSGKK